MQVVLKKLLKTVSGLHCPHLLLRHLSWVMLIYLLRSVTVRVRLLVSLTSGRWTLLLVKSLDVCLWYLFLTQSLHSELSFILLSLLTVVVWWSFHLLSQCALWWIGVAVKALSLSSFPGFALNGLCPPQLLEHFTTHLFLWAQLLIIHVLCYQRADLMQLNFPIC